MFKNIIAVAFQIVFRIEKHVNNIFSFFKNHFWYQHIKIIQKVQTTLNFNKKFFFNFSKNKSNNSAKQAISCPFWSNLWLLTRYFQERNNENSSLIMTHVWILQSNETIKILNAFVAIVKQHTFLVNGKTKLEWQQKTQ